MIGNISCAIGLFAISNVMLRCFQKEHALNYVRVAGACSIVTLVCLVIALLVWESDNPAYDDEDNDVVWAQSLYGVVVEAVLLCITPCLLCQQRKPLQ